METRVGPDSMVTCSKDLVAADLEGEVVMMSIDSGNYYGLNETGSRVWALMEEPIRVSHLCDRLAGEFAVEREQCQTEVLEILNELASDDLIEVVDGAAG